MSNNNKYLKIFVGSGIIILFVSVIILLIYLPILVKDYTVGSNDYIYKTYFFGYWKHYLNGELWVEGGSSNLNNFYIISPILIIVGLISTMIISSIFGFTIGTDFNSSTKLQRNFGIILTLSSFIGLIGFFLQLPFVLNFQTLNPEAVLSSGFYIGISFFAILVLAGIPLAILSKPLEVQRPSYY